MFPRVQEMFSWGSTTLGIYKKNERSSYSQWLQLLIKVNILFHNKKKNSCKEIHFKYIVSNRVLLDCITLHKILVEPLHIV